MLFALLPLSVAGRGLGGGVFSGNSNPQAGDCDHVFSTFAVSTATSLPTATRAAVGAINGRS